MAAVNEGTWTFDTSEPIRAVIEVSAGDVQLEAGERADTVVQVVATDASQAMDVRAAEETQVTFSRGTLLVQGPKNTMWSWLSRRTPSIDVRVMLPADSRLRADIGDAELRSTGRLGESRIIAAYRDVSLDTIHGHTDVASTHGSVRIHRIDGTGALRARHGGIDVGEVTSDARISSTHGDISLDRALGSVVVKSAYGGVRIGEVMRGAVQIESAYGRTELGVREGTAAWLDVSSQNGTVRSELQAGGARRRGPAPGRGRPPPAPRGDPQIKQKKKIGPGPDTGGDD
jgi:hypothetical protein